MKYKEFVGFIYRSQLSEEVRYVDVWSRSEAPSVPFVIFLSNRSGGFHMNNRISVQLGYFPNDSSCPIRSLTHKLTWNLID